LKLNDNVSTFSGAHETRRTRTTLGIVVLVADTTLADCGPSGGARCAPGAGGNELKANGGTGAAQAASAGAGAAKLILASSDSEADVGGAVLCMLPACTGEDCERKAIQKRRRLRSV
jgi:hypothetical protein